VSAIDPIYGEIGGLIRVRRRAIGVTQESLGQSIGLTRTSINNIEHGRQALQVHTLFAIASVLGIDSTALLPRSNSIDGDVVEKHLPKKMPDRDKAWLKQVLTLRE
jgi:transcriptional regulator with XRE-family HTH domain